jgi:hypothetical protein
MRSSRRPARTLPAASQMRAAPNPRTLTGWSGASPHVLRLPCGLSSGFPFARRVLPLRPPSSGFPSSGVLRFVPSAVARVPVPRRFPSRFPFPKALFTLALPRGGSGGVGPGRQGPRSPVLPRPPRLDRDPPALQMGSGCARWDVATEPPVTSGRERRTSPRPNRPDRRFPFTLRVAVCHGGEMAGSVVGAASPGG